MMALLALTGAGTEARGLTLRTVAPLTGSGAASNGRTTATTRRCKTRGEELIPTAISKARTARHRFHHMDVARMPTAAREAVRDPGRRCEHPATGSKYVRCIAKISSTVSSFSSNDERRRYRCVRIHHVDNSRLLHRALKALHPGGGSVARRGLRYQLPCRAYAGCCSRPHANERGEPRSSSGSGSPTPVGRGSAGTHQVGHGRALAGPGAQDPCAG